MADKTTTDITYESTEAPVAETIEASATTVTETPTTEQKQTIAERATAATEMELNVSLDQLSYICDYCGKINAIASPNCVRCGKRRPRAEYINAMNKIKNAESIKARYIEEQAKLAQEKQDATQTQLVRLVESRVADEKAQILARETIRFEQETDDIRRTTARDAVLRIIAAERSAEEKVKSAELRAEEAINGRNREADERIASEREKVLYSAAKRVVSERAGIENAAEERISAERRNTEKKAQETIAQAIDDAEKNAARRAVLKVVATEQAAEDRARIERDAISRAAIDRVAEEKRIAEINAYSKFQIEKEAIERAVDERIKAEREMLYGRRGSATPGYGGQVGGGANAVQPLAIVPYVNSQQPLYQYNTSKIVYKFIPDAPEVSVQGKTRAMSTGAKSITPIKEKKDSKRKAVRVLSVLTIVLAILVILVSVVDLEALSTLRFIDDCKNMDIVTSLFGGDNVYSLIIEMSDEGDFTPYLPPIGIIIMVVGAVASIIIGIIGLCSGKGIALPISYVLMLVGSILIALGLLVAEIVADFAGLLGSIGLIIVIVASLAGFILGIICAIITPKKMKKEKQTVKVGATTK